MEERNYREKLARIFKFLKQYNDIKNPIEINIKEQLWWLNLEEMPDHGCIVPYEYDDEEDTDIILKVRRPELTDCPKPPKEIIEWVKSNWNGISLKVEVDLEKEVKNLDYNKNDAKSEKYIKTKFEDDENRVRAYRQWNEERNLWLEKELPARQTMNIFNEMYSLYARIQKEAETVELMIGDGILYWGSEKSIPIEHPILLQNIKLEFDVNIPEFTIKITEKLPELYSSLFYSIPNINIELLKQNITDLERNNYSPLGNENTNAFLSRVAIMLSSEGRLVQDNMDVKSEVQYPQIYRKSLMFLRKRTLGYNIALDSILEDIQGDAEVPSFLKDVVGCIEEKFKSDGENPIANLNPNGLDENILLTKPANAEQLTVAKHLERYGAVLVQGPPGTGKTHTIANLVGHLLSEGKSILVTSHSEKALSVLKEKVVEDLQPLCLSLLSTTESRMEMERTLDTINENRSRLDISRLAIEIDELQRDRKRHLELLDNTKLKLKNARGNEYRPIVIGGEEYYPSQAAKFINKHKLDADFIPSPVVLGMPLPLTEEEFRELYKTNGQITTKDETECNLKLPAINELVNPIDYSKLIEKKNSFNISDVIYKKDLWKNSIEVYKEEELKDIIEDIHKALSCIDEKEEWTLASIEAGYKEEAIRKQWENLVSEIDKVYEIYLNSSESILEYDPKFSTENRNEGFLKALDEIIERVEDNKKISRVNLLLNSSWKKVIEYSTVNNHTPSKSNEFKALKKYHYLQAARAKLQNRWDRQISVLGVPKAFEFRDNFEVTCKKYCEPILTNLDWYKNLWNPIKERLKKINFSWRDFDTRIDLSSEKYSELLYIKSELGIELVKVIETQILRVLYNKVEKDMVKINSFVISYSSNQHGNVLFDLLYAVKNEDEKLYTKAYERLLRLKELKEIYDNRMNLIERLNSNAPALAMSILNREGIHGKDEIPGNFNNAWLCRQFTDEICERNKVSIEKLQNEIIDLENLIRSNTASLAFKKAWKAKLESFDNNREQVQAIEGWRQIIRKIGAGKGKRAVGLMAEARKLMPRCQTAVPVWIMPLNKVVENFNVKENKFDVVIIDEASQADVMALIALYLGKKVIIVGDNEQVSPLAIGQKLEDIERLIREYLFDIPNGVLYTGQFSIYDLAQGAGYQPVRLKEHFRCVPDIIQYSNDLSYNGEIKPLRDSSEVKTTPFTVSYRVENAISKNKINMKEAEAITALIIACSEMSEYADKTMGVITLRGDKQAAIISNLIRDKLGIGESERRRILCGNSANFQGDERDIIFLSMVDTNEGTGPLRLYSFGNDNIYKKRFNVAASRARDQMWLVHSIDSENDLKPGDIRKGLIEYIKNPKAKESEYNIKVKKAESEFERLVMKRLIEKGYRVVPQWEVGAYRIDMVIEGENRRIALECDGERWHNSSNLEEDMNRQAILERLGWRFIRIRGSEFFKDPDNALEEVYKRLEAFEIMPLGFKSGSASEGNDSELKNRVIMRAEEIKDKWNKESNNLAIKND